HRDIKPSNLLVERTSSGELWLRVVDFGLATELADDLSSMTAADEVLGTPIYMAPEQASGDELLGPPADLYAVGVLLFQLLAGRPPHEGAPATVLVHKLRRPPPLDLIPNDVSDELRGLVADLLERDPNQRLQSAAEVRARLLPHAAPPHLPEHLWAAFPSTAPSSVSTIAGSGRRGVERGAPQLWGRGSERQTLAAVADQVEGGEPRLVLVEGELGLGKTELVEQLALRVREEGRFEVVRATGLERGVLRSMQAAVERRLRTSRRSQAALERAVRAFYRGEEEEEESAAALIQLLRPQDLHDSANQQQRNLATLTRFFRHLAAGRPLLLVIEDAQDGDEDAAALMRHLLFDLWSDPYRLLCVVTQRPEPKRREPLLAKVLREVEASRPEALVRLDLRPLDDGEVLAGLANEYGLGETHRHAIVSAAAGNPAFARMLAGVAELRDPVLGERALPRQLRATLAVMLEERLERVPEAEALRELLQHLAVLGGEAGAELLAAFAPWEVQPTPDGKAPDTAALADGIDALVELALVVEPAVDQLRLAYPTMREVLLEPLPPRKLRRLHLRAAELRKEAEGDSGAIGDHLFAANEPREAVPYWLRAQRSAFHFGDCRQATRWGSKALAQLPPNGREHFDASVVLARSLREITAYDEAVQVLEPLVERGPSPERHLAAELLGEVLQEKGDDEGWGRCMRRIEADLPEEAGPARRAGLRALAFWANHRLDVEGAERYAEEALAGDDVSVDERVTAFKRLFWACFYQADFRRAKSVAAMLSSLAEETGRTDIEAEGLRLLGKIHQETPAVDEAIAAFERALHLYRRLGRQSRVINVYLDIMFVACSADRHEQAMAYVERFEAVRPTTILDYTGVLVRLTELRSRALGRGDHVAAALAELDAHVARTSWGFRTAVRGEWISALLREGQPEQARPMLDDFLHEVAKLPPLVWNATHLELLAEVLAKASDPWRQEPARQALALAATIYQRLGNTEAAEDAKRRAASSSAAKGPPK
ncbi:MAG: AAA family ATPase, partial [Myxococcales bacterium]|nr:AAA family ATPase [Myxococcales bacterium]